MARHVNPTKHIGLWPATALVVGPMLGVGIFIGPPQVAASVGSESAFLLLWIAGGITAMCGALSVAELGAMLPLSGGHYVYLRRAYGNGVGFAVGWLQVLAVFPGSIGTVALALGTYQLPVLFGESIREPIVLAGWSIPSTFVIATIVVILLTAINHLGLIFSSRVQLVLTIVPIVTLFVAAIVVIASGQSAPDTGAGHVATTAAGLAAGYLPVYFAYAGWDGAIYIGGEIRDSGRTLPRSLITGTTVVTTLYLVLCAGFLSVYSLAGLAQSGEAGSAVAGVLLGQAGVVGVTLLIAVAMLGSLNGIVLTGSRIAWAMARDGEFPKPGARLDARFGSPVVSLWAQAAWTIVLMAIGGVEDLIAYASAAMLATGSMTALAVFVLRRREPDLPRPYRTLGYPFTPAIFILSSVVVLAILGWRRDPSVLVTIGWVVLSLAVYQILARRRKSREQPG
ncbi:MAG: amino acid permease [Blastocatellia bacterium]|nr:amino acid permease [Blastocatellia bacterium]